MVKGIVLKTRRPYILTNKGRNAVYAKSKGIFLVHKITGSTVESINDKEIKFFNIDIYLSGNPKGNSLNEVQSAEFYLGNFFGDKIITKGLDPNCSTQKGLTPSQIFGFAASAYGPMLCTCVVTFEDGRKITLEHWIDFEHAKLLEEKQALEQELKTLKEEGC